MLAGIKRPANAPQFLLRVLVRAADGGRHDLALTRSWVGAEAIAQLEGSGRPLADVTGHDFFCSACTNTGGGESRFNISAPRARRTFIVSTSQKLRSGKISESG